MSKEYIDMIGKRFGSLTVVELTGSYRYPCGTVTKLWRCECDCGDCVVVDAKNLRSGRIVSCGCLKSNRMKNNNLTHGGSAHGREDRLYHIWRGMRQRCKNKNHRSYRRYGGRGIFVCNEWDESYGAFRDWAMANGYDPNAKFGECTIDRIDNDDGYYPENCRWVDMVVQANNKGGKRHELH